MKFKKFHKNCNCFTDNLKKHCFKGRNCDEEVVPLSRQSKCGRFKVCKIKGDRKHCARMASLGLLPGEEMEIICPENGSLCVVRVRGGSITLDNDTSDKILITESE